MTIAEIKKTAESKMGKSIEALKSDLQKVRTGRAHPGILDQVHVDYYGSMVPISQVANVTLMDARTISVQPWEKGMGAKIEKAIRESDLRFEACRPCHVIGIHSCNILRISEIQPPIQREADALVRRVADEPDSPVFNRGNDERSAIDRPIIDHDESKVRQ